MRIFALVLITAMLPLVYSCATTPKTVMRQDPLIGKIIDTNSREPVSFTSLMDKLAEQNVVYLSEKHDNPMHHAVQHRIIKDLLDRGRSPVVGFEFFSMEDTPLLLNLMDTKHAKHTQKTEAAVENRVRKQLGWENQSDEMWSYYWDLLVLARENDLTVAGLDLSSSQKRRITRKGMDKLTSIEKKQIFSTRLSDPAYEARMKSIFKTVHCGMGNDDMLSRLYDTWLARNDRMALSIVQLSDAQHEQVPDGQTPGPVIVIMGNGHTEYGLGVIDRVRHLNPEISQVNLALTEIFREPEVLDEYLRPLDLEGFPPAPPADYLWFTQRVSYEDPCQKFKEVLKRMKKQDSNK